MGVAVVAVRAALLRPWSGSGTLLIYDLLDARILRSTLPAGNLSIALGVYYLTVYPRPLMHLRLSICFYSDESKALENCQKRKTSCGSLQGSDSCRISISHEGLTKVL